MMGVYNAAWEDEENNRIVELSVEYTIDGDEIRIGDVTPVSVTLGPQQDCSTTRKLGVWTAGGRRVLSRQFQSKCGPHVLIQQVRDAVMATH